MTTAIPSTVILATARVVVSSSSGRSATVRALLDQGAEVSFITENLAQALRVKRLCTQASISLVGGNASYCRNAALISIASRDQSGPSLSTLALIIKNITTYAPRASCTLDQWTHLSELNLADGDPLGSDPIDLIGADLYSSVILEGIRKGSLTQSFAQNSLFGWVISGPASSHSISSHSVTVSHCSLESDLRKFWEIEELSQVSILSPEEKQCEQHFCDTHSRNPEGRYTVRLPFKSGPPINIGDSHAIARRMLTTLNRRLNKNPDLK